MYLYDLVIVIVFKLVFVIVFKNNIVVIWRLEKRKMVNKVVLENREV